MITLPRILFAFTLGAGIGWGFDAPAAELVTPDDGLTLSLWSLFAPPALLLLVWAWTGFVRHIAQRPERHVFDDGRPVASIQDIIRREG